MTKTTGIPKRWRPRFSLRTLVILVTLVCVYFGVCWEATKRFGVPAVPEFAGRDDLGGPVIVANSPLPFCVRVWQPKNREVHAYGFGSLIKEYRRDYLWMFGWIVHLKDEEQVIGIE